MSEKVIAVFDIGKTNKKMLLFNEHLNLVFQKEEKFQTIVDDDGFECDDIDSIVAWIRKSIEWMVTSGEFDLVSVNFSTYGATLAFVDENGKMVAPLYNYLKPISSNTAEPIYEKYGGREEFCRCTASPALEMLNSGIQIYWLKKNKPEVHSKVKFIMHFPQYLNYCFTGKVTSEYTSIGCHTALWNFDKNIYHSWLSSEGIYLPAPLSNDTLFNATLSTKLVKVGIGIHDSSASLMPYLLYSADEFVLISTGTWSVIMNPFNKEPLTNEQLNKDTLCYLSPRQQQVKSSRLFMGHIHNLNSKRIADYFSINHNFFEEVKSNDELVELLFKRNNGELVFFSTGIPENYIDETVDLSRFSNAVEAYHQLLIDLTFKLFESYKLVIPKEDSTKTIYISGGFSNNELFVMLLATLISQKRVYTSEIDNASALGAALTIHSASFQGWAPSLNLGLKEVKPFSFDKDLLDHIINQHSEEINKSYLHQNNLSENIN